MSRMAETWQLDVAAFDRRWRELAQLADLHAYGRSRTETHPAAAAVLAQASFYRDKAGRSKIAGIAALDLLDAAEMMLDAAQGHHRARRAGEIHIAMTRRAEYLAEWA